MKKKTVGQEAYDRLINPDTKQGIVDTQREVDKEYLDHLKQCVENHRSWDQPFYVVVQQKKERLMDNVVRRYFIGRQTLPTPQWDQTVWRYDPKTGDLRFLWVLPDEQTAMWMADRPSEVPKEQTALLQYVHEMLNGNLLRHFTTIFEKDVKPVSVEDSPYAGLVKKALQTSAQESGTP